jgi:CheY-like chemotaxis protein
MGRSTPLAGRLVLVVEDEPLIALDIVESFRAAGASVFTAQNLVTGSVSPVIRTCRRRCWTLV